MDKQKLMKRPMINGVTPLTSRLVEKLATGKSGDVMSDDELSAIAGVSCRVGQKGYSHLHSAIRICLRDNHIVWERIRGEGAIKCLSDTETVSSVNSGLSRIHKSTLRTIKKASVVNVENLERTQQASFVGKQAQLNAILSMSTQKLLT